MKIKWLMSVLIIALVMASGISCHRNSTTLENNSTVFPRESSLEEAVEVLGLDIPMPSYLPEGYEIEKTVLKSERAVSLMITNRGGSKMDLDISWREKGMLPVRGLDGLGGWIGIDINGGKGYFGEGDDRNTIYWNLFPPDNGLFVLKLSADKDIPTGELLLIAESVG